MVRYYGWYSNKSRGLRKKQGILKPGEPSEHEPVNIEIIDVSDYQPPCIPSKKWRECIKKIYEVDPLCCPKCGGEMKIISFINEYLVIRQILEHLGLWVQKPSRDSPSLTQYLNLPMFHSSLATHRHIIQSLQVKNALAVSERI